MKKSIVITGATSFIGVHVIKECLINDYEVFAVVRPNSQNLYRLLESDSIHIIELEMSEFEKLKGRIKKAEAFLHFAWEGVRIPLRDDMEIQQRNYECSIKAIEVAKKIGCKVFLGAGSQAEYGKTDCDVTELSPCNPTSEYGRKKLLTYEKLVEIANNSNIRLIWTRIFSIYGRYDYPGTLIMSALKKMKNNEPIEMTECTQLWDYLYVEDAARAIMTLVKNEQAIGIYNIASGNRRPLKDYIEDMKDVMKSDSELRFGVVPYGKEGPIDLRPDNRKLLSVGWRPEVTFRQGIMQIDVWQQCDQLKKV